FPTRRSSDLEHGHVDRLGRERPRGADGARGGGVERAVEVFGDDEDFGHGGNLHRSARGAQLCAALRRFPRLAGRSGWAYSNPFCFRVATSSAASLTITPRLRPVGAAWWVVRRKSPRSTSSSDSCSVSIGLLLAFMMSGSLMKRGSFRRRSVVTTAGRSTSSVSSPASTSRVTVALPSATSS